MDQTLLRRINAQRCPPPLHVIRKTQEKKHRSTFQIQPPWIKNFIRLTLKDPPYMSCSAILPTCLAKWSLPFVVERLVMMRWLVKRKHCLTTSLLSVVPMERVKREERDRAVPSFNTWMRVPAVTWSSQQMSKHPKHPKHPLVQMENDIGKEEEEVWNPKSQLRCPWWVRKTKPNSDGQI